jgi:heat-inducible transcriptional repressor
VPYILTTSIFNVKIIISNRSLRVLIGVVMLSQRQQKILNTIVMQYVTGAKAVPSQSIISNFDLSVSSATIRNEMAHLEEEGYILRPHTSAGSIPTDKGYRYYVESIGKIELPQDEQEQLRHVFSRMEGEMDHWLDLAASIIAGMVHNTAVISAPRSTFCTFKHLELVSLQDMLALVILVLNGARVRQLLITPDQPLDQGKLTILANKLSDLYSGLTVNEITSINKNLGQLEQKITEYVIKIMEDEDEHDNPEPYLDGLHFLFSQPEFANNRSLALSLMELIEGGRLLRNIVPPGFTGRRVEVIIGKENRSKPIHDYSIILSRYGTPRRASGTIGVIGPTRMPYARAIATVSFLTSILSRVVDELYTSNSPAEADPAEGSDSAESSDH